MEIAHELPPYFHELNFDFNYLIIVFSDNFRGFSNMAKKRDLERDLKSAWSIGVHFLVFKSARYRLASTAR